MPKKFVLARRFWPINPVTKVVKSKKDYKRTDKRWKKDIDKDKEK